MPALLTMSKLLAEFQKYDKQNTPIPAMRMFLALMEREGQNVADIEAQIDATRSSTARAAIYLEKLDLIHPVWEAPPAGEAGRRKCLYLTHKGKVLARRLEGIMKGTIA